MHWIIESIEDEYVNISVYSPISPSTYIELLNKLNNPRKCLINIKSNKMFWCHIRRLNPLKIHPERITKADKKTIDDIDYETIKFITKADKKAIDDIDYETIKFTISKNDYCKIKKKNNVYINVFCYENDLTYPVYVSDQTFKNCMDLLLISIEN